MNRITITLTPEVMAAKAGLSPEAFSRLSFVRLLDTTATVPDAAFVAAKSQVFQQYDDLHHRLANNVGIRASGRRLRFRLTWSSQTLQHQADCSDTRRSPAIHLIRNGRWPKVAA